ncbi:hypothetical protein J2W22_001249 [Sphingomonas kyeonggiensis]|nr:hypothetical protein [Sphingomonas kyeonggiensis]
MIAESGRACFVPTLPALGLVRSHLVELGQFPVNARGAALAQRFCNLKFSRCTRPVILNRI